MRAFLFLLLLVPLPALAQQTDEQLWLQASATTALGDDAELTLEAISRFGDRAGGLSDLQFGGLLSHIIAKGVEIGAGYRHVQDYDRGAAQPGEERTRQQVTVSLGGGFSARLRVEERFREASREIGVRARPFFRFSLPLGDKGFALFASHEDFVNLNATGWGHAGGYERMRNALGLSVPLASKLKADIGYLNQYRFGRGGARDQMDHAATLALALSL